MFGVESKSINRTTLKQLFFKIRLNYKLSGELLKKAVRIFNLKLQPLPLRLEIQRHYNK